MPTLAAISRTWEALGNDELRRIFPNLRVFEIGWGEPCCFRCGWLAPTPEAADYRDKDPAKAIDRAWNAASGWLERAHLHDHANGGNEEAFNLVPLCPLCHERQPLCHSREDGIRYVNTAPRGIPVAYVQMVTDGLRQGDGRNLRSPGKGRALRILLRAQAAAAAALLEVSE